MARRAAFSVYQKNVSAEKKTHVNARITCLNISYVNINILIFSQNRLVLHINAIIFTYMFVSTTYMSENQCFTP